MQQNNLEISNMKMTDLNEIKSYLENDFDDFWNYNILKSELENENSTYFVAKIDNQIVGFVGVIVVLDEADITNIVIKKDYRGRGFSSIIMKRIIEFCRNKELKKINLEVNSNNITAIKLYEKFEFKRVGERKRYYQDGNAILYSLYI